MSSTGADTNATDGSAPRELKRSLSSFQKATQKFQESWDLLVRKHPERTKNILVASFFVVSVIGIQRYGELADIAVDM